MEEDEIRQSIQDTLDDFLNQVVRTRPSMIDEVAARVIFISGIAVGANLSRNLIVRDVAYDMLVNDLERAVNELEADTSIGGETTAS